MKETLEEAAEIAYQFEADPNFPDETEHKNFVRIFKKGAKWQSERMYSEEEVRLMLSESFKASDEGYDISSDEIIEQFKKK